jgi:hypothetical protein
MDVVAYDRWNEKNEGDGPLPGGGARPRLGTERPG